MKKKVLYIGHSFHQKTLSSKFFIDELKKKYDIDFHWTLPSDVIYTVQNEKIQEKEYYAIIIFQVLLPVEYLDIFKTKNIILIPMYDNNLSITYLQWSLYCKYKMINFSKSLYEKTKFVGIKNNLYLQYAPTIPAEEEFYKSSITQEKAKIFFWQRSKEINWELLKKLINKDQIDFVHMHRIETKEEQDLWFKKPSKEDIRNYNITFSSWFETKEDFLQKLKQCDIFVAPRLYEGIGQVFLEAMALGKCVIAPDLPTMNEYIIHNENGILYNPHYPKELDISDYKNLGKNAQNSIGVMRTLWKDKKKEIIDFIEESCSFDDENIGFKKNIQILKNKLDGDNFIIDDINIVKDSPSFLFSKYLNGLHSFLKNIKASERNMVIYGSGTGAELILSILSDTNKILYLVDKDESKQGKFLKNRPIYSIGKLVKDEENIILISVFGREKEITKNLIVLGINRARIISLDNF